MIREKENNTITLVFNKLRIQMQISNCQARVMYNVHDIDRIKLHKQRPSNMNFVSYLGKITRYLVCQKMKICIFVKKKT